MNGHRVRSALNIISMMYLFCDEYAQLLAAGSVSSQLGDEVN